MSKNFEIEYKKYADSAVPDLWSRIEAGVDAYEESIKDAKAGSEETKTGKIVNIEDYGKKTVPETKTENEVRYETGSNHVTDKKSKRVRNYKPYFGALAAAACMFLVVVVMKNVLSSSNSMTSAESAAAPAAMDSAPAQMEEAAEPIAEAAAGASDTAGTYEEDAEEAYEEASEYSADASADEGYSYETADESPAYEASETSPAYEEEEAAPMEEAPMAEGAAAYGPDALDAEVNGSNTFAVQSTKEESNKRKAEDRKLNSDEDEIKLVCEPADLTDIKEEGTFKAKVTDPLESGVKKGDEITVNLKEEGFESLFNALTDSKSPELTLILRPEDDGTYTLVSAEIKN